LKGKISGRAMIQVASMVRWDILAYDPK
jgi:hypothetical protein